MSKVYGVAVERDPQVSGPVGVVGAVEGTAAGNVILRVGRLVETLQAGSWLQTEHVVLSPGERVELGRLLLGQERDAQGDARVEVPEGLPWEGFDLAVLAAFPPATVANMRRAPEGTFAVDPDTGERYSATPGDYFTHGEYEQVTVHGGSRLVLARLEGTPAIVPAFTMPAEG